MRSHEENEFNAIWFGVSLVTAIAIVFIKALFGQ